jgi:mono/diheme cytochrome c family protein
MRAFLLIGVLAAAVSTRAAAQDGKALYLAHCKKCHGETGKPSDGIKKMNPKIETFDAAFFAKRTDADLAKGIAEGKGKMKPFNEKLKPEETAAVAKYIRTLTP